MTTPTRHGLIQEAASSSCPTDCSFFLVSRPLGLSGILSAGALASTSTGPAASLLPRYLVNFRGCLFDCAATAADVSADGAASVVGVASLDGRLRPCIIVWGWPSAADRLAASSGMLRTAVSCMASGMLSGVIIASRSTLFFSAAKIARLVPFPRASKGDVGDVGVMGELTVSVPLLF